MKSYVLLVIPTENEISKIDQYRRIYAKYTSYIIPPHFTIYPPFHLKNISETDVVQKLCYDLIHIKQGHISTSGFGTFQGKNNVLFLNPDQKSEKFLKKLLMSATKVLSGVADNVFPDYNFTPEKFKPHLTIAEKIPDSEFNILKANTGHDNFTISFQVNYVYLYSNLDKSPQWQQTAIIPLGLF